MVVDEDIQYCLSHRPYSLVDLSWLAYNEEGSRLFELLTEQDDYYVTRTERQILEANADQIIARAKGGHAYQLRIVELGAGTASKTGILLNAIIKQQGPPIHYLPVDVSPTALALAKSTLEHVVPGTYVTPQIANYMTDSLTLPRFDGRTLAVYIGSSIGNFSREQAASVLKLLCQQLQPGDALLLGIDMYKDSAIMLRAYDDTNGISSALGFNFLRRLNSEFGYNFNLDQFRHLAMWNDLESRIELYFESLCAQRVQCIYNLKQNIEFDKGDKIHTLNSYKHTTEQLKTLLTEAGFEMEKTWSDERNWCSMVLGRVSEIMS
jgi:L-histidine N-alpha-methyltransferase